MRFSKPALTIDQQLDQLVNRGMDVGDRASAKHYLSHINYYRLRAYWLPYEIAAGPDEHAFAPQTTLETILDLYAFDQKLRLLVLDAIERIEVSLRARWANVLSLRYGSHAYARPELFERREKICAHLGRLWNREMTVAMKLPSNPSWLKAEFSRAAERRLFNTLVMLGYLLGIISPRSQWRQSVCQLVDRHPHIDLAAMGFPRDWRGQPSWRG